MRALTWRVFFLLCSVSLLSTGHAAAARLDPALQSAISQADPGDFLPIYVVMQEQGVRPGDRAGLQMLPRRERRAEGRRLLRETAERSQEDLSRLLAVWRAAGAVRRERRTTILNGVALTVRADRVADLLRIPGVDRVLWDPPIPAEQLIDGVSRESSSHRSPIASASARSRSIWWQLDKVRAPQCWGLGYDGAGVIVAVLDSGLDYDHPDLSDHVYLNPGEIPGNLTDDDENGFVDDVRGWDFVDGDNDPMGFGSTDHGTLVGGIVAGDGTSGTNTGVAPGATLLPVRVLGASWSVIVQGIDYAIQQGADVIQMSISQKWRYYPKPDYAGWRAVTDNELALGVAHANSVGNEGENLHTDPIPYNIAAPGNCPAPWRSRDVYLAGGVSGVCGVGAIAQSDVVPDNSSRGPSIWEDIAAFNPAYPFFMPPEYQDYPWTTGTGGLTKPDLVAPGPNTLSTSLGGGYLPFEGTSAATPHVAGAMAILWQADSTLTPADLERILELTAVDLGEPGKDNVYGAGCLDVYGALLRVIHQDEYGVIAGTVRDAVTDSVVRRAAVTLLPADTVQTNAQGEYSTLCRAGLVSVHVDAFGYFPDTSIAVLPSDTTIGWDRALTPRPTASIWGTVKDGRGTALRGVHFGSEGTPIPWVDSDTAGVFLLSGIPAEVPFTLQAIHFGHVPAVQTLTLAPGEIDTVTIVLAVGVQDDFELDQGWTRGAGDTAPVGKWERGDPVGTWSGATPVQPEDDASPSGTKCYLTMNCNRGAGPTFSDIDYGTTSLVSPIFDVTPFQFPLLLYRRWFSNNTGGPANDVLTIEMSADSGATWTILESTATTAASWAERSIDLFGKVPLTNAMRIRFVAGDLGTTSTVEAAIDDVRLIENPTGGTGEEASGVGIRFELGTAAPNPFASGTALRFALPAGGPVRLAVFDVQGRWVRDLVRTTLPTGQHATSWDGRDAAGRRCACGVYWYRLEQGGRRAEGRLVLLR